VLYSCPSLVAHLRAMSLADLIILVEQAPVEDLRVLHHLAGVEDPPDEGCDNCPACDCSRKRQPAFQPAGAKNWYFPEEVQELIFERGRILGLFPDHIYGDPDEMPHSTLVVGGTPEKVKILSHRRGDDGENDTAEARANPLLGCCLWAKGDFDPRDVSEHARRPVNRLRNGSPVAGSMGVESERKRTPQEDLQAELAHWRAHVKPLHYPERQHQRTA
jgi:hypothetical protein